MSTLTWTPPEAGETAITVTVIDARGVVAVETLTPDVPLAMRLWGPGDTREADSRLAASAVAAFSANGATITPITSLASYAPNPISVASGGQSWHNATTTEIDMAVGQVTDVSLLLREGTSGKLTRFGWIKDAGDPTQLSAYMLSDAAGVWTQENGGLGEWSDLIEDVVLDTAGNAYRRIRARFTCLAAENLNGVSLRVGPSTATSGLTVELHRADYHIANAPAEVSVALDQSSLSGGDVIGTDVTATVTIEDAGSSEIEVGDVTVEIVVDGTTRAAPYALSEGESVIARATYIDGAVTRVVETAPLIVLGWPVTLFGAQDPREDANAVNPSVQAIATAVAGGTIANAASPDPYFSAPVLVSSVDQGFQGANISTTLTGLAVGDVVDVAVAIKRGTSGLGLRVYCYIGANIARLNRNADGAFSQTETTAGTITMAATTTTTGSDDVDYDVVSFRLTVAAAGDLSHRVTTNVTGAANFTLMRIGVVRVQEAGDTGLDLSGPPIMSFPQNASGLLPAAWPFTDPGYRYGGYPPTSHVNGQTSNWGSGSGNGLLVRYGAGSFNLNGSSVPGGMNFSQRFPGGASYQEAILRYRFRMRPGFLWVGGGKLPGLQGGGAGGGSSPTDTWSLRLMWRGNWNRFANTGPGRLMVYAYFPGKNSSFGENWRFANNLGADFIGEWHEIIQRVRVNDVGQANSEIEIWLDGVQMPMVPDDIHTSITGSNMTVTVPLRTSVNGAVNDSIAVSTFYGGDSLSWSPSVETEIEFGPFEVWAR